MRSDYEYLIKTITQHEEKSNLDDNRKMTAVLIKRHMQLTQPTIPVTKWHISGY